MGGDAEFSGCSQREGGGGILWVDFLQKVQTQIINGLPLWALSFISEGRNHLFVGRGSRLFGGVQRGAVKSGGGWHRKYGGVKNEIHFLSSRIIVYWPSLALHQDNFKGSANTALRPRAVHIFVYYAPRVAVFHPIFYVNIAAMHPLVYYAPGVAA